MLLNYRLQDYKNTFLTISEARITKDLQFADVWVMAMGDQSSRNEMLTRLNADSKRLRKEIAGKLYLRHIPELRFHLDSTLDEAEKIERLLKASGVNFDGEPEVE